ncbi:MAG: GspE/PulE family protein [Candidatus Omnitrophica bacterium]|nr:GspE/PulE family protein [Candidatus Omnitrophota bacterium]
MQSNIEQSLIEEKIISSEQLQMLKLEQQRSSVSLVKAIRRLKLISEDALIDFLSKKLHLDKFSLVGFSPSSDLLALLPAEFICKEKIIPLFKKDDELAVGVLDPLDVSLLEELRFRTGFFIKPYLVKEDELNNFLMQNFERRSQADVPSASILEEELREQVFKPSVIEAVNLLLVQAAKVGASDIHLEPHEGRISLRLRIDGVLKEISPPDPGIYNAFISRIKIMSNLDIAEKRIPQDGRFKVELEEGPLDVRVSVMPTIQGESVVLRLLRQRRKLMTLQELGMSKEHLDIYLRLIQRPSGIILVTGPTGSGKTTTLYASLSILKSVEKNIITIEDPVEYQLDFCRQIQVNPKVNLTFATGLRSILRHDPDIIMVGEIRDLETATIAIQAALTGHLVFSTLHTNDAVSAITRLVDMGIEPFLIASCLNGVVAQRLIRILCPKCKKRQKGIFKNLPFPDKELEFYEAVGCQDCLNTGFSGRVGIFEIMEMSPQIGRLTVEKVSSEEIARFCRSQGMKFLSDDGWQKVLAGISSPQELMRILGAG